jgi:hypothetical protein
MLSDLVDQYLFSGYPDHITFGEFIQKFEGLVPPNVKPTPDMNDKSVSILYYFYSLVTSI